MGSLFRLARSVMAVRRSLARFICVSPGFDNVWVATSMRLAPPVPETGAMRDIAICVRPRAHLRWLRARGSIEKHVGTACRRGQIGRAHARTPDNNAHNVCRLLLEKKTTINMSTKK